MILYLYQFFVSISIDSKYLSKYLHNNITIILYEYQWRLVHMYGRTPYRNEQFIVQIYLQNKYRNIF